MNKSFYTEGYTQESNKDFIFKMMGFFSKYKSKIDDIATDYFDENDIVNFLALCQRIVDVYNEFVWNVGNKYPSCNTLMFESFNEILGLPLKEKKGEKTYNKFKCFSSKFDPQKGTSFTNYFTTALKNDFNKRYTQLISSDIYSGLAFNEEDNNTTSYRENERKFMKQIQIICEKNNIDLDYALSESKLELICNEIKRISNGDYKTLNPDKLRIKLAEERQLLSVALNDLLEYELTDHQKHSANLLSDINEIIEKYSSDETVLTIRYASSYITYQFIKGNVQNFQLDAYIKLSESYPFIISFETVQWMDMCIKNHRKITKASMVSELFGVVESSLNAKYNIILELIKKSL